MNAIKPLQPSVVPTFHLSLVMEQNLWLAFRNGDPAAYALIYRRYFNLLFNYGKKLSLDQELIKDCIQELFIKIWNNRQNLSDTTSVKYYLFTSLKRKLLDTLKSAYVKQSADHHPIHNDLANLIPATDSDDDIYIARREQLQNALAKLSSHQQRLLQLKFYKNLSNKEIADELGITMQSVYNATFKALRSLKKQVSLPVHGNDPGPSRRSPSLV